MERRAGGWAHVRSTPGRPLLAGVALIDALCVLGTWWFMHHYTTPAAWDNAGNQRWIEVHFNLNQENTFATWFSSISLLLAALLAVVCFLADRALERDRRTRLLACGWLGLAAILAVFSLDELGSLHENIGEISNANPVGDGGLLWHKIVGSVLAVIAVAMVAWAFAHVRRNPRAFWLMAIGAVLLFSVPLQEHTGPLREESTELVAQLFFIGATLSYLAWTASRSAAQLAIRSRAVAVAAVGSLSLLAVGLWAFSGPLEDIPGDLGQPKNWFLTVPAVLVAVAAAYLARAGGRVRYGAVALLGAVLAVYYGANAQGWMSAMGQDGPVLREWLNRGLIVGTAAAALSLLPLARDTSARVPLIVAAVLTGFALGDFANYGGSVDFAALSTLLVALVALLPRTLTLPSAPNSPRL